MAWAGRSAAGGQELTVGAARRERSLRRRHQQRAEGPVYCKA